MRINNKGQAGAVMGVMLVVVLLMVGVVILQNLATAFAASFVGGSYLAVYNNATAGAKTAVGLMGLLPILLGAGVLIAAVMGFAGKK